LELSGHKLQKGQVKKQDFQSSHQQVVVVVVIIIIIIIIIAIVIAGAMHCPKDNSSRIVFYLMLLLAVFFITSYSATIVSLLQTSSDTIKTLQDLVKSPLKLSMVDSFVNVSSC
jgi:choline-glycine betaine transporter